MVICGLWNSFWGEGVVGGVDVCNNILLASSTMVVKTHNLYCA
jgi:hypothetical protein